MKKIEDYMHLYLGCETNYGKLIGLDIYSNVAIVLVDGKPETGDLKICKPILRPLSDMSEEEAEQIVMILFSDVEDRISAEEIQFDLIKGDGGNLVDADMDLIIDVSCRCFEGQIAIRKCGTIILFDEAGEVQRSSNHVEIFLWLLSKHFDLFNLIPAGLAIDKTTLE